ncbi:MAG: exopolysaccharide biosynthesis protein [Acetobacteraceae bacterium]
MPFIPASVVLQRLHDEAHGDHFTLGWMMGMLQRRSFGMVMLLFGLAAIAPGVSIVAGLLLLIPAVQMILGHSAPFFPRRIAAHPFPTRHLAAVVQRAVPVLRCLEKTVHPRWRSVLGASGRLVGAAVMILSVVLLLIPIPMSNIVPAMVIVLVSLAWLEEDGLLLVVALLIAVLVVAVVVVAIWETILGVGWISRLWSS